MQSALFEVVASIVSTERTDNEVDEIASHEVLKIPRTSSFRARLIDQRGVDIVSLCILQSFTLFS